MGISGLVYRAALKYPWAAAPALRYYLHRSRVPERFEWLVDSLKRELPLPWQRRTLLLDDGSRLVVDSSSAIGREVYYRGTYEPELCRTLERWLRPGMICVDAGANIGEFSLRAARLVGPTGSVHAFEASPSTFADLEENIRLNGTSNIVANQVALGAAPGTVEFYLSRGVASGSSSLTPAHDFTGTVLRVPSTTFDDYMRQAGLPHIDVIKIDIEGAELHAFHGAPLMFGSPHAPILIFEHHPAVAARFGVSRQDVDRFLAQYGYRLTRLGSSAGARQAGGDDVPENFVALPPRIR